ncbi:MAG: LPS assembly protein LptD, partial [Deltaproteobacteria bacterium]|nr:LPS assembly protein LptD [Deltaproteobacteria bacterium]
LLTREVFDFRADLSTEFWKTLNLKGGNIDRVWHTVKPRVIYDYIPVQEQGDYPNFEGVDRLDEKNILTYSITNYFTARSIKRPARNIETQIESSDEPVSPLYRYRDVCRIKFSQSYDIEEARQDETTGDNRPFSDIKGELEFRPYGCLDVDGDMSWSPYDSEIKTYNTTLRRKRKYSRQCPFKTLSPFVGLRGTRAQHPRRTGRENGCWFQI